MESTSLAPLLTEAETAKLLKKKPNTLAGWRVKLAKGDKTVPNLRAVIVGGSILYRPDFIQALIDAQTTSADGVVPEGIKRRPPGPGRPKGFKRRQPPKKQKRAGRAA